MSSGGRRVSRYEVLRSKSPTHHPERKLRQEEAEKETRSFRSVEEHAFVPSSLCFCLLKLFRKQTKNKHKHKVVVVSERDNLLVMVWMEMRVEETLKQGIIKAAAGSN